MGLTPSQHSAAKKLATTHDLEREVYVESRDSVGATQAEDN
jgi:hypothetical protein